MKKVFMMDHKKLEELNKKFARESEELQFEFAALFRKWMKKSPRITAINAFNLPINLFLNVIADFEDIHEIFPELPMVYMRMVYPFTKLRKDWGKIPNKEFVKKYSELYESQFNDWFQSEEDKENFKKWFEGNL